MKINITNDPKECGYNAVKDEGTILQDDADWMKELQTNIRKTESKEIIRQAEKEFHTAMVEQYGSTIAGELLMRLWQSTKEMRYENL